MTPFFSALPARAVKFAGKCALSPIVWGMRRLGQDCVWTVQGDKIHFPKSLNNRTAVMVACGRYEPDERALVKMTDGLEPTSIIIELGANIGMVARDAIRHKLTEPGLYVAVEANPHVQSALLRNIKDVTGRRSLISSDILPWAVCSDERARQNTTLAFDARANLSSCIHGMMRQKQANDVAIVQTIGFGELVERYSHGAGQRPITLIADIEGAEVELIQSARAALDKGLPQPFEKINQMVIELHGPEITQIKGYTTASLLDDLGTLGFRTAKARGACYLMKKTP